MMRQYSIVIAFALSVITAVAAPITREQALAKAQAFMSKQQKRSQLVPVINQRKLSPKRAGVAASATSEYYVFNKGTREGFIIVSGDDQVEPILGYCDSGEFDYSQMPPAMQEWLDGYARQIASIGQGGAPVIRDAVPTHPKVDQLMQSKWSQGYPYNLTCPEYFSLGRSVTGCVATAIAQIMYYHREKAVSETTAAMPSYDTWTSHPTYGNLHVEGIPEGSPIDWENMKDEYGTATEKQRKAVADLMHYCGVAVKMDYTNSSSGAQSYDAYQAFGKYFGYGSSVRYVSDGTVTSDTEWDRIVYAEIAAGRPVYVSGSNSEGGHAFVADGYDGNLKYHINWGWGGLSDGYYLLTSLTPGQQGIGGSNDGYNSYREIIIGIEPENYGEKTMTFADAMVKTICLENWDANGDGKLTYGEVATIEDIGTAFKGTSIKSFKELYYFTGLTSLPDDAFNGCQQLSVLRLPKNIQSIGDRSLKGCSKLTQLDMPNHVRTIGSEAFSGCSSLGTLSLPDELPAIADGTFAGSALSSVSLPITVGSIGEEAFANCQKLTRVELKTFQPNAIVLNPTAFAGTDLSKATLSVMQGTKSYFLTTDVWRDFGTIVEKRELSEGKFATLEAGKKYYLYHVGTGQYLTKGEAWGTQAIVGDSPMRFVVNHTASMPEGVYYLTSEDTGKTGTVLFRTTTDSNVGVGVKAAFVDGTLGNNRANSYWSIRQTGDAVYTIQTPSDAIGYVEGEFWGVQTSHESNTASPTYGVYGDIDYAGNPTACQWRFVGYDEEAVAKFDAAMALANLLDIARVRRLSIVAEQAVYDQLESTVDELHAAMRSLRKKLGFIDFADEQVRSVCVANWDIDSDGELSYTEASKVNDLGYGFNFQGNTTLTSVDELKYFTSIPDIYGRTFDGCTNLRSIVIPSGVQHIYYYVFRNCKKLESINLPEFLNTLGEGCFQGCSALRSVSVASPDPSTIKLGAGVFNGVPLASCTLYVPFGTKQLYAEAPVWKNFGTIVEIRTRTQPTFSPVEVDVPGYVFNLATRKYIRMGEAYGTQSVVASTGLLYQFRRTKSMADGLYYLTSDMSGKDGNVIFRTSTDTKVGNGVKACFGDGSLTSSAYWQLESVGDNIFTLQVPANDKNYTDGEYLGTQDDHPSSAASPTEGLYWDVKGEGIRWAFVKASDMEAAKELDNQAGILADMLQRAVEAGIDTQTEQAVYDNPESTVADFKTAIVSVRSKMHYITFADSRVQTLCVAQWDTDGDGELTFEEAAAVTSIGETFRGVTFIKSFEELRYFTSLTELPPNAFRGATSLHTLYLPASVTSIGQYAFTSCSVLHNIVILNPDVMVPMGVAAVPSGSTLFVPANILAAYQSDPDWSARCAAIVEYTGTPQVTAEASRPYGRLTAAIKVKVTGAPIDGTPECVCEAIADRYCPVGTYPIVISAGTITTPDVEFHEGLFTVTPATLTITAKSYTRAQGQSNPEFEVTYSGFRNRETDTVFIVRPVVTCEATADSPAGEYPIVVSGAEAANYVMEYVNGTLTVVNDPTTIHHPQSTIYHPQSTIHDLQGRRVTHPRSGVYVRKGRKVVVTR